MWTTSRDSAHRVGNSALDRQRFEQELYAAELDLSAEFEDDSPLDGVDLDRIPTIEAPVDI